MCCLKISSPQNIECGSHIRESTIFHASGVFFKSGPYSVCTAQNVSSGFSVSALLDGNNAIKPQEIGAINFLTSTFTKMPTEVFKRFKNLLSFVASNVQMRVITRDDFSEAKNLTSLALRNNLIYELESCLLADMPKLQSLDLSHNLITSIASGTFDGCSSDLFRVNLSFNKIKELDFNSFKSLANPKKLSVELDLRSNSIRTINEVSAEFSLAFERLNLKNNLLRTFSCRNMKITELTLENNSLESVIMEKCSVEFLDVSRNKLSTLHIINELKGLMSKYNQIKELNVEANPNIYHLDLTNNNATSNFLPNIKMMKQMKHLNLTNTVINTLTEVTFLEMKQLEYLFMKNTGIKVIPSGMFVKNKLLMTLDLSDNNLKAIDLQLFDGLEKLKTLKLNGNMLSEITGINKIKMILPELKEISIAGNGWKCLNLSTMIRAFNQQGINISGDLAAASAKSRFNISGIECY